MPRDAPFKSKPGRKPRRGRTLSEEGKDAPPQSKSLREGSATRLLRDAASGVAHLLTEGVTASAAEVSRIPTELGNLRITSVKESEGQYSLREMDRNYIFDTNVWVDVSRKALPCDELRPRGGLNSVISPLVVTELMWGIVKGGEAKFSDNQSMVRCMADGDPEILELPKAFVDRIIWGAPRREPEVRPEHYRMLLGMLTESRNHADFLRRVEHPSSPWNRLSELDSIHQSVLEKELSAFETIAAGASLSALHVSMPRMYRCGGLFPDPDWFGSKFSAAVEYIKNCAALVRNGAKPRKNNRGIYLDSQLFWYLADPANALVSKEDFSSIIRISPQRSQIIPLNDFRALKSGRD